MKHDELRRAANLIAIVADAMNTIPGDVCATHVALGQVDTGKPRDRRQRDGDGMWCENHERSLAVCLEQHDRDAMTTDDPGERCTGISVDVKDPTGEAAIASAGASIAATRRQEDHAEWVRDGLRWADRGARFGYTKARLPTSSDERLVDGTGCPIDCCPSCWRDTRKDGRHVEVSIERDRHAATAKTGQRVCGRCKRYEDDYGHLPPTAVLKAMRSSNRRPADAILRRLDPLLARVADRVGA